MPVRIDARLGEHSEVVQNMLAKRTPSLAMRSMFGVLSVGCPAQLMAFQRMSSQRMKSTLGRAESAKAAGARRQDAAKRRQGRTRRFIGEKRGGNPLMTDSRRRQCVSCSSPSPARLLFL